MSSDEQQHQRSSSTRNSSSPNILTMLLPISPPQFPHHHQPPFFFNKQAASSSNLMKPNFHLLATNTSAAATHWANQLQTSISTCADKLFTMLHILASKNPFLSRLLSFSSHQLQSFSSKIPFQKYGTTNTLLHHNFAAILPGDSVAGIVATNGILNFLNIYNTVLVVRLVLTWFPNAPPAIVSPLSTICDPYLNIFRGIIPPLGGTLDLSPILAFLVLNAFTSAAAALPAELPPASGVSQNLPSDPMELHTTMSQRKWMRRLAGGKPKAS
ncbi:OLC1v1032003C1 [Oldenlandia corymbosa var. corymbosa]|uniref:OLC1v1032003C1 n=1 Tax=Oldenlandia corymbosa var. corymbosa TaxID=529605 RepID=A0AAV1CKR2_OLDCO|nr:OLC1v1032003C1 [Oldenlandia corymbosa var. corymbosa]